MNTFSVRAFIPPLSRRCIPLRATRQYAVQASGAPTLEIFSHQQKWMQKERAATDTEASRRVDYLRDEAASRLCERLMDINRHFPHVLDLGANACNIARMLTLPSEDSPSAGPRSKSVSKITSADSSETLLYRDSDLPFNMEVDIHREVLSTSENLPYEANTFDAVLSSLSLHWINDLPSVLTQVNNILKPDCPFIGVMMGGDSLFELRTSLQLAELDRRGGVSTHTSPLADVRDVGGLLQRAGFNLLTVDVDDIVVDFPDTFSMMKDLQTMGESNAVVAREKAAIQRDVLLAAEGIYRELHGNEDGTLPATFRLIYMIGWKPSPSQAKPLERGSGLFSIKDFLENKKKSDDEGKK
ncbi:S-adenosyl-L-methionine-dependent methyltransferase [Lindgomyces ingoldianus]|uniref:S-adenosyl-L-methionine-dependent methyltransferase n=1 Tax=Lindgomyces ingoldianus TaxID=673940 RepID=A0ACB6RD53_9PLEO|nr:S-adenosyl-L-methionine-dependent methyltransferase [Lindgomyces ingoldianus]KAF2477071.1 S-adenosyl-L-methionine-dependent methyltransferase [Lindgomyces ingoldianus]